MCKELKERLTETPTLTYIVIENKQICIEMEDAERATAYAKAFNGVVYDHFPYVEYGFEDPYTFTEQWTIFTNSDEQISYEWQNDALVEVLKE